MLTRSVLLLLFVLLAHSCNPAKIWERRIMNQPTEEMTTNEAINRALRIMGLARLPPDANAKAQHITIIEDPTPFFSKQLTGRSAWEVELGPIRLPLKSATPGYVDPYARRFMVRIDAATGQILSIHAPYAGTDPDLLPAPPADAAEEQLRAEGEIYLAFAPEAPRLSLLEALDRVLTEGIGSPFLAKEISATCVLHSKMGSTPRLVWVITLRGLPPMPARGQHADKIPVWQRNHMRNVLDATEAACPGLRHVHLVEGLDRMVDGLQGPYFCSL